MPFGSQSFMRSWYFTLRVSTAHHRLQTLNLKQNHAYTAWGNIPSKSEN